MANLCSQKPRHNLDLIDFDVRNPLEESKHSHSRKLNKCPVIGEEDCDEVPDADDEGIISRKLPTIKFNNN